MKKSLPIVATLLLIALAVSACSPAEQLFAPASTATALPITPQFFATDTPTPIPDPLYLNIIWAYHQPLYPTEPQTGLITRPWVRVRATRDYYDVAAMLRKFPKVHATFSFSPVLARQLEQIIQGARDTYWELTVHPANGLSEADRRFVLTRFFDADVENIISTFPRYKELLDKRGGAGELSDAQIEQALQSFSEQDLRDLQVWFNLASFDADLLAEPPLKELLAKGRDFSEDDKRQMLGRLLDTLRSLFPLYAAMQDSGQIEIATAPYAHPVLPLLIDTDIARTSHPEAPLPNPAFHFPQDADEQLKRAAETTQRLFGRASRGLLPAEGAVAPELIKPVSAVGFEWMTSGEGVLAKSLAKTLDADPFNREEGVPRQADALYRPYYVLTPDGNRVAMIFRDSELSAIIGDTYADMPPEAAAQDMVDRLMSIKRYLKQTQSVGPHLVTLVIDGERAWANYPNDGKQFLNELFERLSDAADRYDIQTVTPSAYLAQFPNQRVLDTLWPGTWTDERSADYSAWIGSPELNNAWSYLLRTRQFLDAYLTGVNSADPAALARAYDAMLLAQGSDWLWGYGTQAGAQASIVQLTNEDKSFFDRGFRQLLAQVYTSVGAPVPDDIGVSILPSLVLTDAQDQRGVITPTINGTAEQGEWNGAGVVRQQVGGPTGDSVVESLYYGVSRDSILFRIDAREDWSAMMTDGESAQTLRVGVYFAKSGEDTLAHSQFTRVGGDGDVRSALGMSATHVLEWVLDPDGSSSATLYAASPNGGWMGTATVFADSATLGKVLEMGAPLQALGGLKNGTQVTMVVMVYRDGRLMSSFPSGALARMTVPSMAQAVATPQVPLGLFNDPIGDDHGPGSYTYPTDPVFANGVYDLKQVTIAFNDDWLTFEIELSGAIDNVWNSPLGISVQTFDIYIDKDPGKTTGERKLLEGRNAVLPTQHGWEAALWIEGWEQRLFLADPKGGFAPANDVSIKVEIDPTGKATIEVPAEALGVGDPATWGYAVVVLSQEAFPSDGVRRVRDVEPKASQWRLGGAPDDTNHTRIIDALAPQAPGSTQGTAQEIGLSKYPPRKEQDTGELPPEAFGTAPMVTIQR